MIPGALGCQHCNLKFRFKNEAEAIETITDLGKGGAASLAILREVRCYIKDKALYPFKSISDRKIKNNCSDEGEELPVFNMELPVFNMELPVFDFDLPVFDFELEEFNLERLEGNLERLEGNLERLEDELPALEIMRQNRKNSQRKKRTNPVTHINKKYETVGKL